MDETPKFEKEPVVRFNRRRAIISIAGALVGWMIWGVVVVVPVVTYFQPLPSLFVRYVIWMVAIVLLSIFVWLGKRMAIRIFAAESVL